MQIEVKRNIYRAMWLIATVLFFLGIFAGYAEISWLIFIVTAAIQALLEALFHAKSKPKKEQKDISKTVADDQTA